MATKTEELVASLPNGAMNFVTREGKTIIMEAVDFPYVLLTTLYRMQEDYTAHGEPFTLDGTLRDLFGRGVDSKRQDWKNKEIYRETKTAGITLNNTIVEVLQAGEGLSKEERNAMIAQAAIDHTYKLAEIRKSRKTR
jgi:hypothetical protein